MYFFLNNEVPTTNETYVYSHYRLNKIYGGFNTISVRLHFVEPDNIEDQSQKVAHFLDVGYFIGVEEVGLDFSEKSPCYTDCLKVEYCPAINN